MCGMMYLLLVTTVVCAYLSLCVPRAFTNLDEESAYECNVTNTSSTPCNVPYTSSKLILHCPGDYHVVNWLRKMPNNETVPICADSPHRTCIVRGYQSRLSNDDSGPYYCEETTRKTLEVMVTILAPPQITNILNYPGQCYPPVKRNQCMASKVTYNGISFDVSVTFDGVGPFYVRWFFNGSEIHCSDKAKKDNCEHNVTRSSEKYSTLTISNVVDSRTLQGNYTAVVSNIYGTNSSTVFAELDCSIPPSPPNRYSKRDWYSNQTENEKLKVTACQIGAPVNTAHYVCFSRDINATFASVLSNWTSCAFCTPGDLDASECYYQFENNNDLAVSVHKESCPLKLSVVIQTRTNTTLSLEDSGKIFCSIIDGSSLTNYTTFHLNVFKREEPTQDLLAVEVAVPTGGVLLIIIALLVVIAVLGYKYRTKKTISQRQRTRTRREGQREAAERTRLVPDPEGKVVQNPNIRRPSDYGSINPRHGEDSDWNTCTDQQSEWEGPELKCVGQFDA